jgi:hypothetical protein
MPAAARRINCSIRLSFHSTIGPVTAYLPDPGLDPGGPFRQRHSAVLAAAGLLPSLHSSLTSMKAARGDRGLYASWLLAMAPTDPGVPVRGRNVPTRLTELGLCALNPKP